MSKYIKFLVALHNETDLTQDSCILVAAYYKNLPIASICSEHDCDKCLFGDKSINTDIQKAVKLLESNST